MRSASLGNATLRNAFERLTIQRRQLLIVGLVFIQSRRIIMISCSMKAYRLDVADPGYTRSTCGKSPLRANGLEGVLA